MFLLQKEADIRKAIRERRAALASVGETGGGSPLIIIVGSLTSVKSVHVSIADLRYEGDGVVEAIGICFKAHHAIHLKYPAHSSHIWVVLQRGIYDFTTSWDHLAGIQHSWIKIYQK